MGTIGLDGGFSALGIPLDSMLTLEACRDRGKLVEAKLQSSTKTGKAESARECRADRLCP